METHARSTSVSRPALWTGRVLSGLPALFLIADAGMKFAKPAFVVEATTKLGYSEGVILPLGAVLMASTLLYLVPVSAVFGAVLLTAYLGGAVATHVFAGHGAFEIVFPMVFGVLLWSGLVLRNARIRSLMFTAVKGDRR